MQMPERARIRALKEEVIKHIEENNVRNFPGCEGKLFLISTAYPGVWLEHAYDAVSYANYTPEGRQVLAGEMRLVLPLAIGKSEIRGGVPHDVVLGAIADTQQAQQ